MIIQEMLNDVAKLLGVDPSELRLDYIRNASTQYQWNNTQKWDDNFSQECGKDYGVNYAFRLVNQRDPSFTKTVAFFKMTEMPSCCAFVVSHGSVVGVEGKGVGTRLNRFRQDLAKAWGYSGIICTDVDTNKGQRRILEKEGWKDIFQRRNARTNNLVNISVKEL